MDGVNVDGFPDDLAGRPEFGPEAVRYWLNRGFTQAAIARVYGKSRERVRQLVEAFDLPRSPRQMAKAAWPFDVRDGLWDASPYKRLRDHAEYKATGGRGMSADKLYRLRLFYQMLREGDLVVEYDPSIPPIDGVNGPGGWAYRPRRREIDGDDLIIRNNPHVVREIDPDVWSFPIKEP